MPGVSCLGKGPDADPGTPPTKVGADALDPARDIGEQVWQSLLIDGPWGRKGEKIVKRRFFGLIRAGRREASQWSSRLFGYLTVCLDMDFLGAMNNTKMKVAEPKPGKKQDTSSKKEGAEEMALRKAAGNQMVMGTVFMLDSRNRDILLCILEAVSPLERWYGEQREQPRLTGGTHDWMKQQLPGEFLRSVAAVFDSFHEKSLEVANFSIPAGMPRKSDDDIAQAIHEDGLAEIRGDFASVVALWVDVAGGVISQRQPGEGANGVCGVSARLRVVLADRRE